MQLNPIYLCKIQKSDINENYTVWLPEQPDHDMAYALVELHNINQGELWEILLKTAAHTSKLEISEVYFQPEADVFVAYTDNFLVGKRMELILNKLILDSEYFNTILLQSPLKPQAD
ncbi:hypothetical protein [Formosa algae]|uniref:Uncharacterized protein n=1 Tax=Formosa algae TaxID=225843 RepID=A0A9X1C9L5_9FLAO|nr:hypothetical protein [Formosa algae]MBP1840513.1 hypothetical protein [Formosa algae]MDQ0336074.1 hypothetical protein [Formosa algae]OEI81042.1 hypothetical protein AST99_05105 [Formosa algae]PNW26923.1 hypothetical protein BKP44_15095 [Formosa algae]